MTKSRRLALLFGLLALMAAVAVPAAVVTGSKGSPLKREARNAAEPDAPAIGRLTDRRGNALPPQQQNGRTPRYPMACVAHRHHDPGGHSRGSRARPCLGPPGPFRTSPPASRTRCGGPWRPGTARRRRWQNFQNGLPQLRIKFLEG